MKVSPEAVEASSRRAGPGRGCRRSHATNDPLETAMSTSALRYPIAWITSAVAFGALRRLRSWFASNTVIAPSSPPVASSLLALWTQRQEAGLLWSCHCPSARNGSGAVEFMICESAHILRSRYQGPDMDAKERRKEEKKRQGD